MTGSYLLYNNLHYNGLMTDWGLDDSVFMKFIDKNKGKAQADQRIEMFLRSFKGNYPDDLYGALRTDTICKNDLVFQLLQENEGRCCYCMRDIKGTTLEYVVPRSINDKSEYERYLVLDSELQNAAMVLEEDFLQAPTIIPPYPHTIAYENLVPSCFGNFGSETAKCCNNKRGDLFIHPLIFRKTIEDEIEYKTNGSVVWKNEPYDPNDPQALVSTITILGLDCLELKAIRMIWCHLATNGLSYANVDRKEVIYTLISNLSRYEDKGLLEMLCNFESDEYWSLIAKYSYFNDANKFVRR